MSSPVARVDPRIVRSRELILDAALVRFLEHGYLDVTVEAVAAGAGVAKRTVYNLYGSKDDLFRAVMRWATARAERFVVEQVDEVEQLEQVQHVEPVQQGDEQVGGSRVGDELTDLAVSHARAVVTPRVIAVRRLLIGEAQRFPDLAAEYFDRVPSAVIAAIARRMRRYAASGELEIADADEAATHFAYLVLGAALDRALFHGAPPSVDALDAAARAGAATFLRAHAPA